MPGYFTVDHNIGNSVSAKAVGSVKASCHFPCCKQARNRSSIGPQDMKTGIHLDAAHGVVNGRFDPDGIKRWCLKWCWHLRAVTPKVFINACLLKGGVTCHGCTEGRCRKSCLGGQGIQIIALRQKVLVGISLNGREGTADALVKHQIGICMFLIQNSGRYDI